MLYLYNRKGSPCVILNIPESSPLWNVPKWASKEFLDALIDYCLIMEADGIGGSDGCFDYEAMSKFVSKIGINVGFDRVECE
ncbi:MAG: hypothetical protein MJZ04_00310 [Bacteroidales bacterium]|nr:hypothetical protein [Bacteroidales bacterium]